MKKQDSHRQAVERFSDASEYMHAQHAKMREDIEFSDPSNPKQWNDEASKLRKDRVMLTFDRTNKYVNNVVNAGRQSKPGLMAMPVDGGADLDVAEKLNGIIRHIEYVSRANIAYDTALACSARNGLGWIRIVPEVINHDLNEQEIRIKRVLDPLSCYLQAGWLEPDGTDAKYGFVESLMQEEDFKKAWPKAKMQSWEGTESWFQDKHVRICEYFDFFDTEETKLKINVDGQDIVVSIEDFEPFQGLFEPTEVKVRKREVRWWKLSGADILEQTTYPGKLIPLVPIIGNEIWVNGKRNLCGLVRMLADGQRAYNYERTASIESKALQPKAPFMIPVEAMEGVQEYWERLDIGNPSALPYNHVDAKGNPIPAPQRMYPPTPSTGFDAGARQAVDDMDESVGMYPSSFGQQSNSVSGIAKQKDIQQGELSSYHYIANRDISLEQVGRIIVGMIPLVYDQRRIAKIIGEDGEQSQIEIDPSMQGTVRRQGRKIVAINPSVGNYDIRLKPGPSYTTQRQQAAEQLAAMLQNAPDLMPILGDVWMKMQDWPEAERVSKRLKTMLPQEIKDLEQQDDDIPPEARATINQMQGKIQEMDQVMQQAAGKIDEYEQKLADKTDEVTLKAQVEKTKLETEQAKAKLEEAKLILEAQKLELEKFKAETERFIAQQEIERENQRLLLAEQESATKNGLVVTQQSRELSELQNSSRIPQVLEALGELMRQMAEPKEKTMTIQAPSGQVYTGIINTIQ